MQTLNNLPPQEDAILGSTTHLAANESEQDLVY